MSFNKKQTEFPTMNHYHIWFLSILILPIEVTLPKQVRNAIGESLAGSCEQMQSFFLEHLQDVYNHADEYPTPNDFLIFFKSFAETNKIQNKKLIIPHNVWDNHVIHYERNKIGKEDKKYGIDYNKRLEALKRVGIFIDIDNDYVYISSLEYPDMFHAMKKMAQTSTADKSTYSDSFKQCDFRILCKEYKYDKYESALLVLSDESWELAGIIEKWAVQYDFKRKLSNAVYKKGYQYNYFYKGEEIINLICGEPSRSEPTVVNLHLKVCMPASPDDILYKLLEKESAELQLLITQQLKTCNGCSKNCGGKNIIISGKQYFSCVCNGLYNKLFVPIDIDMVKKIIELRIKAINHAQNKY